MNKVTASTIQTLLAARHSDDIFVPECKDGPTHTANHLRMDAWTMKKSWVNPLITGYEVKVSRSDFLNDQKWHNYLDYCNEFYFVCPAGLIGKDELPAEAGLIYVAKTGTRLFKKKAAPRRTIELPESLLIYIIMCRATIDKENVYKGEVENPNAYWENWLLKKDENTDLGHKVSRRMADIVRGVGAENKRLKIKMRDYDDFIERISELGFDVTKPINGWEIRRKIDELSGQLPSNIEYETEQTIRGLNRFLELIKGDDGKPSS